MSELRKAAQQSLRAFTGLLTFNPTYDDYENGRVAVDALRAALAQPEQEPEPKRRTPLTKQQIKDIDSLCAWGGDRSTIELARAVERAHGIGVKK